MVNETNISNETEEVKDTPKRRGRKPLTPEEKEARAKAKKENKVAIKKSKNDTTTLSSVKDKLSSVIGSALTSEYIKKVNKMKNADEVQILSALIQGFVDGSIEFEEKTIITVKGNK